MAKIIYTKTDEAPALATESLLPIVKAFAKSANVTLEQRDISLAGRIIASFPELLTAEQKQPDDLAELGALAKQPEANIVKLPNISASIPQLQATIKELQSHGYKVPDYPENPETDQEKETHKRYAKVLGSAVNPVLREGNSDRRVAAPVKAYAQKNPHRLGAWNKDSKSHVAHMRAGDFFASEKSHVMTVEGQVNIEFLPATGGDLQTLKSGLALQKGEIIDASVMSKKALQEFFAEQIGLAKQEGVLLSLHMKATMMKISDPRIFGHCVRVYYASVFEKHAETLTKLGVDPNNGVGDVYAKIGQLDDDARREIEADLLAVYETQPPLAMVDSDRGTTNLHVPSDIIIDASMPAAIRSSGQMWGPDGKLHDTKMMIPDRCYAGIYQEVIDFCRNHGAFDVPSMGSVANVGLMAQKAEEYGSHDKTFELAEEGVVRVCDHTGLTIFEHKVESGDIWRMCQTKDEPVRDWVKLAVRRARATQTPAVFWLNDARAHDANLISKVKNYLAEHDTDGLAIEIKAPVDAMRFSLERVRNGEDTISVTGNVLRDYLTDLFPILELGTSAKMLSIVPLLNGGGLYETGAGGSAPKHVQQFEKENHLRWDSLGEFLALGVAIEELGEKTDNKRATILARTLNEATSKILDLGKSPSRKVGELDNRGSHFYLAMYWAQALASQNEDESLQQSFVRAAKELEQRESQIVEELNAVQGQPMDIGGYYQPDPQRAAAAMRPSETFNEIIASLSC